MRVLQVENIRELQMGGGSTGETFSWNTSIDHSKWAMQSSAAGGEGVCVGAINRYHLTHCTNHQHTTLSKGPPDTCRAVITPLLGMVNPPHTPLTYT